MSAWQFTPCKRAAASAGATSAMGHSRPIKNVRVTSAIPPIATEWCDAANVETGQQRKSTASFNNFGQRNDEGEVGSRANRWPPTYVQARLAPSPWQHERWQFPATAIFPASSPTAALPQEDHRRGWCRRCRSAVYRSPRDCRSASGCHTCSPDAGSGDVLPNLPMRGSRECRRRSEVAGE